MNLFWNFLPLTHVKIKNLLLLLGQPYLIVKLVFEETIVITTLFKISLHFLCHLQGLLS